VFRCCGGELEKKGEDGDETGKKKKKKAHPLLLSLFSRSSRHNSPSFVASYRLLLAPHSSRIVASRVS